MGKIARASLVLAAGAVLFAALPVRAATFANIGFEAGDTGWTFTNTQTGHHSVCDETCGAAAYAGSKYLRLESGDGDFYVKAVQDVQLEAGERISGAARFFANDECLSPEACVNDNAHVQIRDAEGDVVGTPWAADHLSPGADTWTPWSFTIPADGEYEVRYAVRNAVDNHVDSVAIFDSIETTLTAAGTLLDGTTPSLGLRATLTRTDTGAPMPNKTIQFSIGGSPTCEAITDAEGVAVCGGPLASIQATANLGFLAEFDGDIGGVPAQDEGTFLI